MKGCRKIINGFVCVRGVRLALIQCFYNPIDVVKIPQSTRGRHA